MTENAYSEFLKLQNDTARIHSEMTKIFLTPQNESRMLRDVYLIVEMMQKKQEEQERVIGNLTEKLEKCQKSEENRDRKLKNLEEELQKSGEIQKNQTEYIRVLSQRLEKSEKKLEILEKSSAETAKKVQENQEKSSKKLQDDLKFIIEGVDNMKKTIEVFDESIDKSDGSLEKITVEIPKKPIYRVYNPLPPLKPFQIFIKMNETLALNVREDDTIGKVKQALEEKTGIPARTMWMVYHGKPLQDRYRIGYYNIQRDSTIYVY